ncbi:MAG: cytochrome c maturation protein CcmE [Microthrixaceae bacterium]
MDVNDDPESPDAAPLDSADSASGSNTPRFDLGPRTSAEPRAPRSNTRRWIAVGALVVLVAGLGFVLFQGLNDAATFFYNVDEAVDQRAELEDERFRMQGNVENGTIEETDSGVSFVVTFNGVAVPVTHTGTPPELFGTGIPVVIEGSFEGNGFASDEILIRHDNEYDEDNPERIDEAERDAQSSGAGAGEGVGDT